MTATGNDGIRWNCCGTSLSHAIEVILQRDLSIPTYVSSNSSCLRFSSRRTFDWMVKNFGEEIAEVIRLQPAAKRFLATVVPKYFSRLNIGSQRSIYSEGGFMTVAERISFGKNRCHQNAMKVASWIDRGRTRNLRKI